MIISHRYGFIFLKTEKTASSSLERIFRDVAGAEDHLYPADRSVRRKLLRANASLAGFSFKAERGALRRMLPAVSGLHRHARARDVRDFIGADLFAEYKIITSERNPFDRQVSLYSHRQRDNGSRDLSGFSDAMCSPVYNLLHHNRLDNWGIYSLGGEMCAHHVIRFENLHRDLAAVLGVLGIDPGLHPLPHAKQSRGEGSPSYRTFYTDAARQRVASWYQREIDHFGYTF